MPCNCLCVVIDTPHDCTAEGSTVLTVTDNVYVRGHDIDVCGPCADAWQTAKPHRVIRRRVNLHPLLTYTGRRA